MFTDDFLTFQQSGADKNTGLTTAGQVIHNLYSRHNMSFQGLGLLIWILL